MSDWLDIAGKVVIVTGGSSGIGRSIVENLLKQNAQVANFDVTECRIQHENLLSLKVDVSSKTDIEEGIYKVMKHFKTIDGLVNNAGINIPSLLIDRNHPKSKYELSEQVFDKMIAVNQKSVYLMSQAVGRILVQKGSGVIVTRSWAKELGKRNVRVVGVAPGILEETGLRTQEYEEALSYTRDISVEQLRNGYSRTSTIPLGRSGKLQEVADLVCYYLSERSSYITGVTTNISGGKTRG